jgi:hypothetical protein
VAVAARAKRQSLPLIGFRDVWSLKLGYIKQNGHGRVRYAC